MKLRSEKGIHGILLVTFLTVFIWSMYNPKDWKTWSLEIFPVVVMLIILLVTYNRFKLTTLLYVLIWLNSLIVLVGGHYTYSDVPLFNWIRDVLGLKRNYYDRLAHFILGFTPALLVRELLLRKSPLKQGKALFSICVGIGLAVGALYELMEWLVAETFGRSSRAFLGTQGDQWDTQWDMFLVLVGSILSLTLFSKLHDRFLKDRK